MRFLFVEQSETKRLERKAGPVYQQSSKVSLQKIKTKVSTILLFR